MEIEKGAYNKAIEVLEKCDTPHGFHAAYPGYKGVWARDSTITSLGASLLGEKFKDAFKKSLELLGSEQSKNGQIPNAVMFDNGKHVDYKSIDSTLWWIVGNYIYAKRFDKKVLEKNKGKINLALNWLRCQDWGEQGMLAQHPTSDWQDAFPHRYGYTINTQALWYYVLTLIGDKKEAARLKKMVNEDKDDGLWNGQFYYSYRWKNHNAYREIGDWFDSLGNLLAVVFGLADSARAKKILDYIRAKGIDKPYPVRSMDPPLRRGDKNWWDYFEDCNAREPFAYLNGGVWTFIGGFYVLALLKAGKLKDAEKALEGTATANMQLDGNYSEWLHGKTGRASADGGNQAWNAGMYVLAYNSVEKKMVLL